MAIGKSEKDDTAKAAGFAGRITGLHHKMTAMKLLLDDPEISTDFRNSCVEEIRRTVDDINVATHQLEEVSEVVVVDDVITEGFKFKLKATLHTNRVLVGLQVAAAATEAIDWKATGDVSIMSLLRQGVEIDGAVKTLVLEIGTLISSCLLELMYFMTCKEIEKRIHGGKEKLINKTDPRFQRFRDSIPDLLQGLSWLEEEDNVVSKKLVPLLKLADGQLGPMVRYKSKDAVFQCIAKKALGDCLEDLTLVILNTQACLGVPMFANGDGFASKANKQLSVGVAFLLDEFKKLRTEVRIIDLQLGNFKKVLQGTDKRAFQLMNQFLQFMQDKIKGTWIDMQRKAPIKVKKTSRGLDVETTGTSAVYQLEECKNAFYKECIYVVGRVFAGRDPNFEDVNVLIHQIYVAAVNFSDLYGKMSICCDEDDYANMLEKIMPEAMQFKERVGSIHIQKQSNFLTLLKKAKELLEGGTCLAAAADKENYNVDMQAVKIGKDLSRCLIRMMIMLTSEDNEAMKVLFEMYKSLLHNIGDVINHATPGGPILGKVNNVVKHGQEELLAILNRRKLTSVFVCTEWPAEISRLAHTALEDIVQVSTELDLLLTLPVLPDMLEQDAFDWLFKELNAMEVTVQKVKKMIESMYNVFRVNDHLKDRKSIKEFLERVSPLLVEIWDGGLLSV